MSVSSPTLVNKPAISFPNPPVGRGSSTAALRIISRIASSILRPFRRARRCNRALTAFSMLRTTNWAIASSQDQIDIMISHEVNRCNSGFPAIIGPVSSLRFHLEELRHVAELLIAGFQQITERQPLERGQVLSQRAVE